MIFIHVKHQYLELNYNVLLVEQLLLKENPYYQIYSVCGS